MVTTQQGQQPKGARSQSEQIRFVNGNQRKAAPPDQDCSGELGNIGKYSKLINQLEKEFHKDESVKDVDPAAGGRRRRRRASRKSHRTPKETPPLQQAIQQQGIEYSHPRYTAPPYPELVPREPNPDAYSGWRHNSRKDSANQSSPQNAMQDSTQRIPRIDKKKRLDRQSHDRGNENSITTVSQNVRKLSLKEKPDVVILDSDDERTSSSDKGRHLKRQRQDELGGSGQKRQHTEDESKIEEGGQLKKEGEYDYFAHVNPKRKRTACDMSSSDEESHGGKEKDKSLFYDEEDDVGTKESSEAAASETQETAEERREAIVRPSRAAYSLNEEITDFDSADEADHNEVPLEKEAEGASDPFGDKFRKSHYSGDAAKTKKKTFISKKPRAPVQTQKQKQNVFMNASTPQNLTVRKPQPSSTISTQSRDSYRSSQSLPTPSFRATNKNSTEETVDRRKSAGNAPRNITDSKKLTLTKINGGYASHHASPKAKRRGTPIVPGKTFNHDPSATGGLSQHVESSTPVRPKRNPRKWDKKSPDVVDLLESDDESIRTKLPTPRKDVDTKAPKSRIVHSVPVIALGKKLFQTDCRLLLDHNRHTVKLLGKAEGRTRSSRKRAKAERIAVIDLEGSSLKAIKYYLFPTERSKLPKAKYLDVQFSFLAFKVEPDKFNDLKRYTNAYKFDPGRQGDYMSYIVVRFESNYELSNLLNLFGEHLSPEAASRFVELTTEIDDGEAHMYAAALLKAAANAGDPKNKVTDDFVAGRAEDDILLVYPFAGNEAKIEEAAADLNEARGVDEVMGLRRNGSGAYASNVAIAFRSENKEREIFDVSLATGEEGALCGANEPTKVKKKAFASINGSAPQKPERRHFLTIQVRDFVRLCPGEFLNDSLIDFWIQWITRNLDGFGKSVHCFSSHFFTTLMEDKKGVTKWTANKGINVFEKKFVFIPVNENLHWSLCVVVNPGYIMSQGKEEHMACLLFLDSLKAHKKKKIYEKVRDWLNKEWQRIKPGSVDKPFQQNDFPLLNPRIPYQDNSWDCGVFVCKYAYAVYSLVNRDFRRNNRWFERDLISNCDEFKFDMSDIGRLRSEIRILIERLSEIYLPWKKEENRKLKEDARKEKSKSGAEDVAAKQSLKEYPQAAQALSASSGRCSREALCKTLALGESLKDSGDTEGSGKENDDAATVLNKAATSNASEGSMKLISPTKRTTGLSLGRQDDGDSSRKVADSKLYPDPFDPDESQTDEV